MQVLSRRTKNNPVLIGEPGVGKTAIVEGLAQRIVVRRRAGVAEEQARRRPRPGRADRRRQVPRRVRGPPQGRAQGGPGVRGRGHPLHRRAAHAGRRRRGRGRHGRRQHAQAHAGPRRAALRRRHHAGRVPEAHREGRGAGAALPARVRGRAHRGATPSPSCAASRSATRSTTACASRTPRWWPRPRSPTATSPTASCPTRPSTSMDEAARRLRIEIDSHAHRDRRGRAPHRAARDRAPGPVQGEGQGLAASAWRSSRRSWPTCRSAPSALQGRVAAARRQAIEKVKTLKEQIEQGPLRAGAGHAPGRPRTRPPSCATASSPSSRRSWPRRSAAWPASCTAKRLLKEEVDAEDIAEVVAKWTGIPVTRMLEGEVEKLLRMEDRLRQRVVGQDEALLLVANAVRRSRAGPGRPAPAHRLVPLPGPHRRGQDRAGPRAGRVPVRRREGHGAHRHVRVHGEAHRGAADRRAARLRRLRRGRAAHRGRAPPAVRGGALRRDREGAPRRVQRAAAGAGRRPPDRRQGPHRGLPQHRPHHDLQHRLRPHPGAWPPRRGRGRHPRPADGRAAPARSGPSS